MRHLLRSVVALSALSMSLTLAANATTYTATATLTDTTTAGNVTAIFPATMSFDDPPNASKSFNYTVNSNTSATGDELTLTVVFSAPGTGSGTLGGDPTVESVTKHGHLVNKYSIQWEIDSQSVPLTNGSVVTISTPDTIDLSACDTGLCGSSNLKVSVTDNDPAIAAAPEPSSLVLLGTGLVGAAGAARRKFVG